MPKRNKFGLSRHIPEKIQREIRRRSKNGCVVCRRGIFDYEHINPEFAEAKVHDPERICLLCGACHTKVTRGLLTKETVLTKYLELQNSSVQEPHEFFDFVGENPKLLIGGFIAVATPENLLEIDGTPIFRLLGKSGEEPAGINAIFSDDRGHQIFSIAGNRWEGPSVMYDLDTAGPVFEVRLPDGNVSLRLRYRQPDSISVERIDMRHGEWHLLASEHDLAIGRYVGIDSNLIWMHLKARVNSIINSSCLVRCKTKKLQFLSEGKPRSIYDPFRAYINQNGRIDRILTTRPAEPVPQTALNSGISWPDIGLSFLVGTDFSFAAAASGVCSIEHARYHFFRTNRMNAPALLLPAVLNKSSIDRAVGDFERSGGMAGGLAPEPFLVKPDKPSLERWKDRQCESRLNRAVFDEKPDFYWGVGTIKLSDSYNGPAMRVARE